MTYHGVEGNVDNKHIEQPVTDEPAVNEPGTKLQHLPSTPPPERKGVCTFDFT